MRIGVLRGAFCWGLTLLCIALCCGGVPQAKAQSSDSDDAKPVLSGVLIVSMDRILRESAAGGSVQEQAESLRERLRASLDDRRKKLRDEERELAKLRDTMERDAFDERVADFEAQVRELRRDEQGDSGRLQRAVGLARAQLREQLAGILVQLMTERGAGVMIDKKQVLVSANGLDVTDEAIKRLDAVVSRLEVNLTSEPE
ncbi:MAG: OmpH family outer membrane protein [Rhodobacteraceae bacterium]|nr:OmpH family outer membrane protein [Paracoccaceae bacterium]